MQARSTRQCYACWRNVLIQPKGKPFCILALAWMARFRVFALTALVDARWRHECCADLFLVFRGILHILLAIEHSATDRSERCRSKAFWGAGATRRKSILKAYTCSFATSNSCWRGKQQGHKNCCWTTSSLAWGRKTGLAPWSKGR